MVVSNNDSDGGISREIQDWSQAKPSSSSEEMEDVRGRILSCDAKPYQILDFSKDPAKYFAEVILKSLNSYDHIQLYDQLKCLCTSNATFFKHAYSFMFSPETSNLTSHLFPSLEGFCDFFRAWFLFIPDGVFQATHHRVIISTPPTLVFISSLSFTGFPLTKHVDFVNTSFEQYPFAFHEQVALWEISNNLCIDRRRIEICGSLAIHINLEGFITRLDLYITLVSNEKPLVSFMFHKNQIY